VIRSRRSVVQAGGGRSPGVLDPGRGRGAALVPLHEDPAPGRAAAVVLARCRRARHRRVPRPPGHAAPQSGLSPSGHRVSMPIFFGTQSVPKRRGAGPPLAGVYGEFVRKLGVRTHDEGERRLPRCMDRGSYGPAAALPQQQQRNGREPWDERAVAGVASERFVSMCGQAVLRVRDSKKERVLFGPTYRECAAMSMNVAASFDGRLPLRRRQGGFRRLERVEPQLGQRGRHCAGALGGPLGSRSGAGDLAARPGLRREREDARSRLNLVRARSAQAAGY
jgi:hypothetical protein